MITRKKLLLLSIFIGFISLTGCSKDSSEENGDNSGNPDKTEGFAPEKLPVKYKLVGYTSNNLESPFFWIDTPTTGQQVSSMPEAQTPYTYTKIGDNEALFSCSASQTINGPIRSRKFYWSGTLTFTSSTKCTYNATKQYIADGVDQGTTNERYNLTLLKQ